MYDSLLAIPYNKVGLLLGTSKLLANGQNNKYFDNRIKATVALYKAAKIKYIVISGDNSTYHYNEPEDMKQALLQAGIPENAIYLDYAGFRTLDSVVRCKEIFGQHTITIVSQPFHNARAIFIARQNQMEAVGYNATDVNKYMGIKTRIREVAARVKLYIDLYLINKQPKFMGEKIEIV